MYSHGKTTQEWLQRAHRALGHGRPLVTRTKLASRGLLQSLLRVITGVSALFCLGYFGIFFPLIVVISLPEGNTLAVLYQISHLPLKISSASQDTFWYIFLSTGNKMHFIIPLYPCLPALIFLYPANSKGPHPFPGVDCLQGRFRESWLSLR